MAHHVTDRIVVGLQRSAAILAALAVLVVAWAIGWTTSAEALLTAVIIASLSFALPGVALFAVAYWLDGQAASLEGQQRKALAAARDEAARHPFREPFMGYAVAVLATLVAWGLRVLIDPFLPGSVPFISCFVAVAITGWIGGYGPAVLATVLSACIARYFYTSPFFSFELTTPADAVVLGSFVFICLALGGLTAALHTALKRVQYLANEVRALKTGARVPSEVETAAKSKPLELGPDTDFPPLRSD